MILTAADMKALLVRARKAGTLDRWCELAIEWMEKAEQHIQASASQREYDKECFCKPCPKCGEKQCMCEHEPTATSQL